MNVNTTFITWLLGMLGIWWVFYGCDRAFPTPIDPPQLVEKKQDCRRRCDPDLSYFIREQCWCANEYRKPFVK